MARCHLSYLSTMCIAYMGSTLRSWMLISSALLGKHYSLVHLALHRWVKMSEMIYDGVQPSLDLRSPLPPFSPVTKTPPVHCGHALTALLGRLPTSTSNLPAQTHALVAVLQVSGAIAQTMATYTAGHSMLTALFGGKASS